MKRDMDLIRRIAMAAEALPARHNMTALENVDADTFATHVIWMEEAGLLKATISESLVDSTAAHVHRLTWAGCEFLDAARNDTIWRKVKDKALKPGMSFTFDLLKELLKAEISQGLPTLFKVG